MHDKEKTIYSGPADWDRLQLELDLTRQVDEFLKKQSDQKPLTLADIWPKKDNS